MAQNLLFIKKKRKKKSYWCHIQIYVFNLPSSLRMLNKGKGRDRCKPNFIHSRKRNITMLQNTFSSPYYFHQIVCDSLKIKIVLYKLSVNLIQSYVISSFWRSNSNNLSSSARDPPGGSGVFSLLQSAPGSHPSIQPSLPSSQPRQ